MYTIFVGNVGCLPDYTCYASNLEIAKDELKDLRNELIDNEISYIVGTPLNSITKKNIIEYGEIVYIEHGITHISIIWSNNNGTDES